MIRRITGWQRFKREQTRVGEEERARMKWKRLPFEAKRRYEAFGKEAVIDKVDATKKIVVVRFRPT